MGFIDGMKSLGNKLKPFGGALAKTALMAVPGGAAAAQLLDTVGVSLGTSERDPNKLAEMVAEASPEQAAAIRAADQAHELEMFRVATSHEQAIVATQGSVIKAEAKGDSWLQRNWRPIGMLVLLALIVSYFYGFTAPNIDAPIVERLLYIFQYGLTGYVGGRSAEKIAKTMFPNGWQK